MAGKSKIEWTDDDLDYAERQGEVDWLRDRPGPTLAIAPDPQQGITPKWLARIESFIERTRLSVLSVGD